MDIRDKENMEDKKNKGKQKTKAGYEYLVAYKITVPIYDYAVQFANRYLDRYSRTRDQWEQAARSGTQNIAEGAKQQSLSGYIKLAGVARGSLEELLKDCLAFARQNKLLVWPEEKSKREIREIREIWDVIRNNPCLPDNPDFPELPEDREKALNLLITLINQANTLIDRLIESLKEKHTREGGFTEKLLARRLAFRRSRLFSLIPLIVFLFPLIFFIFLISPIPAFAGELSNQFTVELWVKPVSSAATKALLVKNNELRLVTNSSSQPLCQIYSGGAWQTAATSSTALPLNTWSHVACSYDKTTLKVFLNGVLVGSQALSVALDDSATNFRAGSDEGGTYGDLNGSVDDIRIYNYARTEKQIVEDMNAGHPAVGSPVGSAVAHYKFDEGYGSTVNNSGNGGMSLNGTLGAGSSAPSWTNDGKFGKALSFDGNDYAYVNDTTNSPLDITQAITLSAWIYSTDTQSAYNKVVAKLKDAYYPYQLDFDGENDDKIYFILSDGSAKYAIKSDEDIPQNTWTHIVGTYDGSIMKLYINGKIQSETLTANFNIYTNNNPLYIGGRSDTQWFKGLIDEVKIYNYALSEDEIKAEYNRGAAMILGSLSDTSGLTGGSIASNSASAEYCVPGDTATCAPPVGRWDFEEKTGQYAYDTSGNGNNGTLGASASPGSDDPTWTSGKIGGALKFDGSNDYVSVSNPSVPIANQPYSIVAWFNPRTMGVRGIVGWGNYGSVNQVTALRLSSTGFLHYWWSNDLGVTTGNITNTWHHVVAQFDGTYRQIFLDGKKIAQDTPTGHNVPNSSNFRIGSTNNGEYFDGFIDSIRIYNYARTPAQIAWDYNRGKPVAYYKLDECSGSIVRSTNNPYNPSLDATLTVGASGSQTSTGTCASGNSAHAWYNGSNGKFNASLNFDGTDDYATTGNIALIAAASQTYSNVSWGAWVKASSNQTSKTIIHKNGEFRLYTDSNGYPTCQVGDTGNTAAYSSTLPNNTWSHLLCTYDGSNIRLYINGKLAASNSRTGTITSSSSTNINIAQKSDASQRYAGQIDEVKIWNYGLTSTLVKNEYDQSAAIRFGPESGTP